MERARTDRAIGTPSARVRKLPLSFWFAIGLLVSSSHVRAAEIRANIQTGAGGFTAAEVGVIEAAVEWWEAIIKDDIVFDVQFRKMPLAGTTRGSTSAFMQDAGGTPTSAIIDLDNTGGPTGFFIDETPHQNEEFQAGSNATHMTARPGSTALGMGDMLSIVKHELCHALGFTRVYTSFNSLICDPGGGMNRTFKAPDCNATLVPSARGTHLDTGDHEFDAMNTSVGCGQRRLTSPLDKKMLEAAFDFQTNCPETTAVPFMDPLLLVLLGSLLVAAAWSTLGRARFRTASGISALVLTFTVFFLHCSQAQPNRPQPGQRSARDVAGIPSRASSAVVMQELTTFSEIANQDIAFWVEDDRIYWKHTIVPHRGAVVIPKEGSSSRASTAESYDELWNRLEALDLWTLGDDTPVGGIEDASIFRFTLLRDNQITSFSGEGIDVLKNQRYRQIYDEIVTFLEQIED